MQIDARRVRSRAIVTILLFMALVVTGNLATGWVAVELQFELLPGNERVLHHVVILSIVAYTLLMAVPFVPGAEIGLALIVLLGPKIAALVYLCTVIALATSFIVGRLIPEQLLVRLLRDMHLTRASHALAQFVALGAHERLRHLLSGTPSKIITILLHHRYLAIAVALNVPGNVVIGGGGGIAMMAGLSRLFSPQKFLLVLALAVSPVPLTVYYFGGALV